MMRVLVAILCFVAAACTTVAEQQRTFDRVPVLLDLYAVDYGTYCVEPCSTPKRYTLMYESGATGVLRIAGRRNRTRKVPAATIADIVRVLDGTALGGRADDEGCLHCRHWFVSVRVVGAAASFDDARPFDSGNPEWIVDVLKLLGEEPPANGRHRDGA